MMFEKKNSKRARVKKKRKERKKDECFFLLFSPSQKKNLIHSHKTHRDIKYQIPLVIHFLSHERKHTHIYIYIFIIIIYK